MKNKNLKYILCAAVFFFCNTACSEDKKTAAAHGTGSSVSTVEDVLENKAREYDGEEEQENAESTPEPTPEETPEIIEEEVQDPYETVDIDLTGMNSNMIYSEISNIMYNPLSYVDQSIKVSGIMSAYYDEYNDKYYYACIVPDALACCAQGIEFELSDGYEYPANEEDITVAGVFKIIEGENYNYCVLENAVLY